MSNQVPNGFPRFKQPKKRANWPSGDYRCPCGSGQLSYVLFDDLGDPYGRGCNDCSTAKHTTRGRQKRPIKS